MTTPNPELAVADDAASRERVTLTDKIAESIAATEFPNTSPYWTPQERAEIAVDYLPLAHPIAAVFAEWLTSTETQGIIFEHILGRTGPAGAKAATAALAAEARKGAAR